MRACVRVCVCVRALSTGRSALRCGLVRWYGGGGASGAGQTDRQVRTRQQVRKWSGLRARVAEKARQRAGRGVRRVILWRERVRSRFNELAAALFSRAAETRGGPDCQRWRRLGAGGANLGLGSSLAMGWGSFSTARWQQLRWRTLAPTHRTLELLEIHTCYSAVSV
ncbi:hypothetical protein DFH27DRAFT_566071 [Peziza echinospora]|nr:hypothetical protein DFH27DRAFT_566071 [Peziza echinospora]